MLTEARGILQYAEQCDVAENHRGINPNSPPNYSDVDKRFPINQVRFTSALNSCGELTHDE